MATLALMLISRGSAALSNRFLPNWAALSLCCHSSSYFSCSPFSSTSF